jgi:hypothetical protein
MTLPDFNKYLVFADEAGDHLLLPNYPDFPLFVLAFCIVERQHYAEFIAPQLLKIKLKYFQDSHIILHERDIRKAEGAFSFLTKEPIRREFMNDLTDFMTQAQFTVIASVIRKDRLQNVYSEPGNPYDIGTAFCIERLLYFLNRRNQTLPTTVAFEARGKKEDDDLELSFLRFTQTQKYAGRFNIKILPKISNCCGLQLADLIARPIGRHVLNPAQANRAFDIIKTKMDSFNGKVDGCGLKIFP